MPLRARRSSGRPPWGPGLLASALLTLPAWAPFLSPSLDVVVDLGPWAGQTIRLSLRTDPRQDPSFDWSGWAEPAVVRVDPLTADRMLRSTAELQGRVLRP